jgi:hypothetical protein
MVSSQAKTESAPIGRIAISAKGTVSFDGTAVSLDGLKPKLAALKSRGGIVWYYREAPVGPPPANAMDVMKLIMHYQLPISMSSKPDYSDEVMPDGTSRPRAR